MKGRSVTPTQPGKGGPAPPTTAGLANNKQAQTSKAVMGTAIKGAMKPTTETQPRTPPTPKAKPETPRHVNTGAKPVPALTVKKEAQMAKNYQSGKAKAPEVAKDKPGNPMAMSLSAAQFPQAQKLGQKMNSFKVKPVVAETDKTASEDRSPRSQEPEPLQSEGEKSPTESPNGPLRTFGGGARDEDEGMENNFSPGAPYEAIPSPGPVSDIPGDNLESPIVRESFRFSVKTDNQEDNFGEIGDVKDEYGGRKISVIRPSNIKGFLANTHDISGLDPLMPDPLGKELGDEPSKGFLLEKIVERDEYPSGTLLRTDGDRSNNSADTSMPFPAPTIRVRTPSSAVDDPSYLSKSPTSPRPGETGFRGPAGVTEKSDSYGLRFKARVDTAYDASRPEVRAFVGEWLRQSIHGIVGNFESNSLENPDENSALLARYMNKDFRTKIRARNQSKDTSMDSLMVPNASSSRLYTKLNMSRELSPQQTLQAKKRMTVLERTNNVLEMISAADFDAKTMEFSQDNTLVKSRNSVSKRSPTPDPPEPLEVIPEAKAPLTGGSERKLEAPPEGDGNMTALRPVERSLSNKATPLGLCGTNLVEGGLVQVRGDSPDKLHNFPNQNSLTSFQKNVSVDSNPTKTFFTEDQSSIHPPFAIQTLSEIPVKRLFAPKNLVFSANFGFSQRKEPPNPPSRHSRVSIQLNYRFLQPLSGQKGRPKDGKEISDSISIISAKFGLDLQITEPNSTIATLHKGVSGSIERLSPKAQPVDQKMRTERAIPPNRSNHFQANTPDKLRSSVNLDRTAPMTPGIRASIEFGTSPQAQFAGLCKKIIIYESKLEQLKESLFANDVMILHKLASRYAEEDDGVWKLNAFPQLVRDLGLQIPERNLNQTWAFIKWLYGSREWASEQHQEILLPELARFILPKKQSAKVNAEYLRTIQGSHLDAGLGEDETKILKNIFVVFTRKLEDLGRITRAVDERAAAIMFDSAQDDGRIGKDKIISVLGGFGMPVQRDHAYYVMREFGLETHETLSLDAFRVYLELGGWHL